MVRTRELAVLTAASAGTLAWGNLAVPRLPDRPAVRTGAGVAAATGLLALARTGGVPPADLGLSPARLPAGLAAGGLALGGAGTAYGLAWALPAARAALAAAAPDPPRGPLAAELLVHIPLGTVLAEELIFRGVLDALARRALPPRAAAAWQTACFALWHVETARRGPRGRGRPAAAVGEALLTTAVAGAVFGWLRRRTGSLLAPAGLHLGSNALGLVAATLARRDADRGAPVSDVSQSRQDPGGHCRNGLPSENAYP